MVKLRYYHSNRRLYSFKECKYINYMKLREYILNGLEVKIDEDESGKDVTAQILIKALFNVGHELSVDTLRELIHIADKTTKKRGATKASNMLSIAGLTESEIEECKELENGRGSRGGYGSRD